MISFFIIWGIALVFLMLLCVVKTREKHEEYQATLRKHDKI